MQETKKEKVMETPGLEELMERISFPRWEIKQHPKMGMHGLRIPNTKVVLGLPGGSEVLEGLRYAHELEVDSYRKRLFALLMLFETPGIKLAEMDKVPEPAREEYAFFVDALFGHLGSLARTIVLNGEKIVNDAIARGKENAADSGPRPGGQESTKNREERAPDA